MEIKHNRPSWVLNFNKPSGTEIKFINGHWYLYERSSIWDSEKGKAKKKSGKLIGTITENGLILKKEKNNIESISCFEFGASFFLYKNSLELKERLETYYSEYWKIIYALVLMKVKENCSLSDFKVLYEDSYLKLKLGKLFKTNSDLKKAIIFLAQELEILENFFNIEECNQLIQYYEKLMNKEFSEETYLLDSTTYKNIEEDLFELKNQDNNTRDEILTYGLSIINFIAIHLINSINNIIAEKGFLNEYRFESVMSFLKTIHVLKQNRTLKLTKLIKDVEKLCSDLEINFSFKN